MEFLGKEPAPISTFCEWCYAIGTSRCGRCHIVYYCSREHQMQHWSTHKKVCKKSATPSLTVIPSHNSNSPSTSQDILPSYGEWHQNDMSCSKNDVINPIIIPNNGSYNPNTCNVNPQNTLDFHMPTDEDIFSSFSEELLTSSENSFWDLINTCDAQNITNCEMLFEGDPSMRIVGTADQNFTSHSPVNQIQSPALIEDVDLMQCAPLNDICTTVVHDMNKYGICVLDQFVGANYGNLILQEVKNLYMTGIFKKGELVNANPYQSKESVRCDVTTWVDGTEPNCKCIGNLIKKLDAVVTSCNKMANNGHFSKYKLHRRTKAMIACYPGDGTYYKKHIDNPHEDGRCITCIYYLNQNWDTKTHGGLLRMFPSCNDSQVANIEPIFDRMLFFWSDKRNPHEVLPAYATRFAITVWYFDADERDRALMLSRIKAQKKPRQFT